MKTLQTIQTLSKVGKILSKIVFVCCIVGFCFCVVGIVGVALGTPTLKLGGVTIDSLLQNEEGKTVGTLYAYMAAGAIVCIGEGVLAKFAEKYFHRELEDGTPFTLDGAKDLLQLGVLSICLPVGAQAAAQIVYKILAKMMEGVEPPDLEAAGSIAVGVLILILSLVCRYGAELNENKNTEGIEMEMNIIIRPERPDEYRVVEELVRESFWNVYRPGCLEHYVLHCLRDDPAFVKELDFVMEKDGELIGQNMFMRAVIRADDGSDVPILTMGPICIAPAYKRQGYGKILLDYSLEKAAALGFGALCFEGNIGFYGKSGFTFAREFGVRYHDLPEGADDSFFLCKELIPGYLAGVTGEYAPPAGYLVDENEADAFDKAFPPKEKLKLPGQLF